MNTKFSDDYEDLYTKICDCFSDCNDLNLLVINFCYILQLYENKTYAARKDKEHNNVEFLMAINFKGMLIIRLLALIEGYKNQKTYSLKYFVDKTGIKHTEIKKSYDQFILKHKKLIKKLKLMRDKVLAHNDDINSSVLKELCDARTHISNRDLNNLIKDIAYFLKQVATELSLPNGVFSNSAYEVPMNNWLRFHYPSN